MVTYYTDTRLPTSDISVQWIPLTGTDNWAMVQTNDGDTSYVYKNTDAIDIYGFSPFTLSKVYTVVKVRVHVIAARVTYGGFTYETAELRIGGVNYLGTQALLGGAHIYTDCYSDFLTNPAGGAWTPVTVNSIQGFGTKGQMPSGDMVYLTQCYIEVTYMLKSALPNHLRTT